MLKYERIAQEITNAISNNEYKVGDKLPSVEQLKSQYQVSKSTIIKALGMLQKDGMIYQTQGSGIYVRNKNKSGYINLLKTKGFSDNLQGHQVTSKVLTFKSITPNDEVREHLRLTDEDTNVYYVERIRYLDHNPLCIETSYFNQSLVTHLDLASAERSIFDYLQSQLKINIGFSDIYFYIDFLSEQEAQHLNLNQNDPCMRHDLTFYTTKGTPFDYSNIVYHYKYANFFIPIES
ncbi:MULTISPECIES: GntR family transcriptional regulator [unclassified Staphylococcus]|uniref:GntR family transcriptional regulator n=1 Tax=unclassified Staphylococcus TaxID=91994 RepID=UPI00188238A0|nr:MULTISPECIES: GntR family transcriptional regulator [unclassified Staphylococcus]MBF2758118.1 GntR family transcriptional regulator [Staphylococcus haemolyticus]MBF2773870.1 GntR family transcriptional regulator [Staphylococcus haemolyticus]MBF2776449.1 GntR family transcriptional regulator [Staphylococcus haemolyticus]MBF2815967.1 GntR family transcriptional regulator [Staphylococcus haemolyticus]MBF9719313.1 GntR family transcriptional regulator [Staphylococcus haemolyticus]